MLVRHVNGQIRALILENTFLSLPRLVPSALPVLGPFAFLCHQKWDSASKIPLIPAETPMLLLSGVRDEVVPREHMRGLWELVEKRVPGGQRSGNPSSAWARAEESPEAAEESVKSPGAGAQFSKIMEFSRGTHSALRLFCVLDRCADWGGWHLLDR